MALVLAVAALSSNGLAQLSKSTPAAKQPAEAAAAPEPTQDLLGRSTPRGTVLGFLAAAYAQKYDTAAQYLDTRASGQDAAILAKQLFVVLDRKLPAKLNNLSNDPLGSQSDPVDPRRELIGSVVTDKGSGADIYLERIDRSDGTPIWLFSRQTLVDIPDIYDEISATAVESLLPDFLLRKYFRITLFAWIFYLVFLPLLYVALSLLNRLVGAGAGYALRRWTDRKMARNPTMLPNPIRILILSCTIFATLHEFSFPLVGRQVGSTTGVLLLIVAFVWAMFLINGKCEIYFKKTMESRGRLSATSILRPLRRVMDLIAIFVGLMFLLHSFGINPTATLAGLGVGGIAIALAAQKTLENMIGGASLIMDGAVRVGDAFRIGDVVGTIEVIGLRSTRVRTLDRTVITIPNGQVATMTLENFSARDKFWLRHVIGLDYGTTSESLNSILAEVRTLLDRDPRVLPITTRVRFLRFAESSLELEVFAYVVARDWNHFLEIQEELLMKIKQLINAAGAEFAFPSRTLHIKSDIASWTQPAAPAALKDVEHEMQSR